MLHIIKAYDSVRLYYTTQQIKMWEHILVLLDFSPYVLNRACNRLGLAIWLKTLNYLLGDCFFWLISAGFSLLGYFVSSSLFVVVPSGVVWITVTETMHSLNPFVLRVNQMWFLSQSRSNRLITGPFHLPYWGIMSSGESSRN